MSSAPAPRRLCLITGGSSGIGAAFADVYAAHGYDLVLTARRLDRLEAKAAALRARHGVAVHVVATDLVEQGAVAALVARLAADSLVVDALVNNAGFGLPGSYLASDWPAQRSVLRLLLDVPAELVHALAPAMVARGFGRIVNVASVAGLVTPTAGHTLYPATKSALIKFSQSLNLELSAAGVHVTALCPGFTYSEFHDVNGTRDIVSQMPKWMWLTADSVAADGFAACEANRPISIPGAQYKAICALARLLPERAGFALMRRAGGRIRKV